ncbi:MAG: phenylalanine--tRNA ligase subunit beta [Nitrososphaera sp.]|nr:phenylalanine--tRNA ligase subunit beta [Nitrososphaera sp.]
MPVVDITLARMKKLIPEVHADKIIEMIPYAALDIEGIEANVVRVEYNPNRPDFSSDYGIARTLRGLLDIEVGMPRFKISARSDASVLVDRGIKKLRPYILALVARGGSLKDDTIRQLIAMQEDLHNGIGRRRVKASIGLHDMDNIRFPVTYTLVGGDYSFVPLGETSSMSISQILSESETGRKYGHIFEKSYRYPLIVDKAGSVLSLPPLINGNVTKVGEDTRNLFVEVTATDKKAAQDMIAIIAMTLFDAGFKIGTVSISSGGKRFQSPLMKSDDVVVDLRYINSVLGLELNSRQAVRCLRKSRLDAKSKGNKIVCSVPRYRTDISHPIDIAEEVAIGYGIYSLVPTFPASTTAGRTNVISKYFAAIRETLAGIGVQESLSFSLTSRQTQYECFGREASDALSIDGSKSIEHEILRDSLLPSLLLSLARNIHEEYPQKIFEIGKTFHKDKGIIERWNVAAAIAHGDVGFTEIKSAMQAMLALCFGKDAVTTPAQSPFFIQGRSAEVSVKGMTVGTIGEITPLALETLKMRVPVAAFEINLTSLLHLL